MEIYILLYTENKLQGLRQDHPHLLPCAPFFVNTHAKVKGVTSHKFCEPEIFVPVWTCSLHIIFKLAHKEAGFLMAFSYTALVDPLSHNCFPSLHPHA